MLILSGVHGSAHEYALAPQEVPACHLSACVAGFRVSSVLGLGFLDFGCPIGG